MYRAGLHLISEFKVANPDNLRSFEELKDFIDQLIKEFHLSKVGEVYHQFEEGGFTGVVCLTESHLSIHTWPEFNRVTFDVFLSNFLRVNDRTTESLHDRILEFLQAHDVRLTRLTR